MTSLKLQLEKLAVEHVKSALGDGKKRASFMYDPKEAREIDKETIFCAASNAISELSNLNSEFSVYEDSLFSSSSVELDRLMVTKDVNAKLDAQIKGFFVLLSPYFLLRPAHKAIEWLIYRFHVHTHNIDDFLRCTFPYYDHNLFVRSVQVCKLSSKSKWEWLLPSKKAGVPVSSDTVAGRVSTDMSFLDFVCDAAAISVKTFGKKNPSLCHVSVCFFLKTICTAISNFNNSVPEKFISHCLPYLLSGFKSQCSEYRHACYMITALLCKKCSLTEDVLKKLCKFLLKKCPQEPLSKIQFLTLQLAMDGQCLEFIPKGCLQKLLASKESVFSFTVLPDFLRLLCSSLIYFSRERQKEVDPSTEAEPSYSSVEFLSFLNLIVKEKGLSSATLNSLLPSLFTRLVEATNNSEIQVEGQIIDCLLFLNRRYPKVFDDAIVNLSKRCKVDTDANIVMKKLTSCSMFASKYSTVSDDLNLFLCLNHSLPDYRRAGLSKLFEIAKNDGHELDIVFISEQVMKIFAQEEDINVLQEAVKLFCFLSNQLSPDCRSKIYTAVAGHDFRDLILPSLIPVMSNDEDTSKWSLLFILLPWILLSSKHSNKCLRLLIENKWALKFGSSMETALLSKCHKGNSENVLRAIVSYVADSDSCVIDEFSAKFIKPCESASNLHCVFAIMCLIELSKRADLSIKSSDFAVELAKMLKSLTHKCGDLSVCNEIKKMPSLQNVSFTEILNPFIDRKDEDIAEAVQLVFGVFIDTVPADFLEPSCHSDWLNAVKDLFEFFVYAESPFSNSLLAFLYKRHFSSQLHRLMKFGETYLTGNRSTDLNWNMVRIRFIHLIYICLLETKETIDTADAVQLIYTLTDPCFHLRRATLKCVAVMLEHSASETVQIILKAILDNEHEILSDNSYFYKCVANALDNSSCALNEVLQNINDSTAGYELDMIHACKSPVIFPALLPLLESLMTNEVNSPKYAYILQHIPTSIYSGQIFHLALVLKKLLQSHLKSDEEYISVLTMEAINADVWSSFDLADKCLLFDQLIRMYLSPKDLQEKNRVLYFLTSKVGIDYLLYEKFWDSVFSHLKPTGEAENLSSLSEHWSLILASLEVFASNPSNVIKLSSIIPRLLDVLEFCVEYPVDSANYSQQLILSSVLVAFNSEHVAFCNLDPVYSCLSSCNSSQIQNLCLQVITHCLKQYPNDVVKNVTDIFRTVGEKLLQRDYEYSLSILQKTLGALILALAADESSILDMLKAFMNGFLLMPVYRRYKIFPTLFECIGFKYLMYVPTYYFKGAVIEEKVSCRERVEEVAALFKLVPASDALHACSGILHHLSNVISEVSDTFDSNDLFNSLLDSRSFPIDTLYMYIWFLISFLEELLKDERFRKTLLEVNMKDTKDSLSALTSQILQVTVEFHHKYVKHKPSKQEKAVFSHICKVLELSIGLQETESFVYTLKNLLSASNYRIKHKAIEVLLEKLRNDTFEILKLPTLLTLIDPLLNSLRSFMKNPLEKHLVVAQCTLAALTVLSNKLGNSYAEEFVSVLELCYGSLMFPNSQFRSSILICLAELSSQMKLFILPHLNAVLPVVLQLAEDSDFLNDPSLLSNYLTCVQKLLHNFSTFLTPFIPAIVKMISAISTSISKDKNSAISLRLQEIRNDLGCVVPHRILFPAVVDSLDVCSIDDMIPLLDVLSSSLNCTSVDDLNINFLSARALCLRIIETRSRNAKIDPEVMMYYEDKVIEVFVSVVLKISERTFIPLFNQIFDQAFHENNSVDHMITFFRLCTSLSDKLTSLFTIYTANVISKASELLTDSSIYNTDGKLFSDVSDVNLKENKIRVLIVSIIDCLHSIFKFDGQRFIDFVRFDSLLDPLVDQLENKFGGSDVAEERISNHLCPCIGQLARASDDVDCWRKLIKALLFKSRSKLHKVRLMSLEALLHVCTALGNSFQVVLPDAVPFLAELMEDKSEIVSKRAHAVIVEIEKILGEDLQTHFD